jgi:hypothetical protein
LKWKEIDVFGNGRVSKEKIETYLYNSRSLKLSKNEINYVLNKVDENKD